MKNLIEITNEIIRKHEKKIAFKYPDVDIPLMTVYHINDLSELEYLPEGSVAICNGKIYMNMAMQVPTEILTVTGDLEW